MVDYAEMKKNKKLTNFEDIREIVIANAVKGTRENKKTKEENRERLLTEF